MHNFVRSEQERVGKQIWSELCLLHPRWPNGTDPFHNNLYEDNPLLDCELKKAAAQKKVYWTWTGTVKVKKKKKRRKVYAPLFLGYLTEYRALKRGTKKGQ